MKILIIGGDAAGMSAASQIRRRQPEWPVTVLERGQFTSYAACGIPYYFAGDVKTMDELVVVTPEEFRSKRGIDVRMGWEAVGLDAAARTVRATRPDGGEEELPYDRLLLATGASPIVPPWEGVELEGVVPVRNLHDTRRLEDLLAAGPRRSVIVGGGYIGLEMAEALSRRGLEVTLVEMLNGLMGGADPKVTELATTEMEARGIEVRLETRVEGFAGRADRLERVVTNRGELAADLALVCLGVRPNSALAAAAGIPLGASKAIHVDPAQRTGADGVYAAGDCAEAFHLVLGRPAYVPLALTANRQGRVAGANMAGGDDVFPGIVGSAVTKVFELAIARVGIDERSAREEGVPYRTAEVTASSKAHYFPGHAPLWVKILFRRDNHKLLGAWLVGKDPGAAKRADILATAITAGMTVGQVADLDLSYAPPFAPVWDPVLQAANRARFALEKEEAGG